MIESITYHFSMTTNTTVFTIMFEDESLDPASFTAEELLKADIRNHFSPDHWQLIAQALLQYQHYAPWKLTGIEDDETTFIAVLTEQQLKVPYKIPVTELGQNRALINMLSPLDAMYLGAILAVDLTTPPSPDRHNRSYLRKATPVPFVFANPEIIRALLRSQLRQRVLWVPKD